MKINSSSKNKQTDSLINYDKNSRVGFIAYNASNPLVPKFIFYFLILVSLTIPNLIFSGIGWFDTLHIMKWVFAMVPIALMSIIGGLMLCIFGPDRTMFKMDLFGWIWLIMLGYISIQPLWVNILSWSTYMKEWFFFATLIAAYIFCYNLFKDSGYHKLVLWCANINAALNVVFAELLIRNMNGPFRFIMNVPGNYIGNTGQQEMFGLWMAIAVMNGIYLNAAYTNDNYSNKIGKIANYGNLLLLALNAWGLWNCTTRGGILSLITGTIIISIIIFRQGEIARLKKIGLGVLVVVLMLTINIGTGYIGFGRSYALISKTKDMVENPSSFGVRNEIWRVSWTLFMQQPIKGVGIGHYKWNYLEAQSITLRKNPEMKWQYTYWAHNEYLQWLAEFGLFGGALLLLTGLWWIWTFTQIMIQNKILSLEASWACSMLFLIWFDAIFSRPFHRIENALWLSLAFALANREILPFSYSWSEVKHSSIYRIVGFFLALTAVVGLGFLGSGLSGDKYLRKAGNTDDAALQSMLINKARRLPMTKDEAESQYAYHLMAVAKVTGRPEDWSNAINQLYKSFTIRPQAKQLIELVNLAQQTKNQKLLSLLVPYLRPAEYQAVPKSEENIQTP